MFVKYPKIPNKDLFSDEGEWYVTEKVHGANFSVIYDKGHVSFASRNRVLPNPETFFKVGEKLELKITHLADITQCDQIQIVGELFGDGVQKDIVYVRPIDFVAFDILLDNEYISRNAFLNFIDDIDLEYIPEMFRGSKEDALRINPKFFSRYNGHVLAEGFVLRPVVPRFENDNFVIMKKKPVKDSFQNILCSAASKGATIDEMVDDIMSSPEMREWVRTNAVSYKKRYL